MKNIFKINKKISMTQLESSHAIMKIIKHLRQKKLFALSIFFIFLNLLITFVFQYFDDRDYFIFWILCIFSSGLSMTFFFEAKKQDVLLKKEFKIIISFIILLVLINISLCFYTTTNTYLKKKSYERVDVEKLNKDLKQQLKNTRSQK